MNQRICSVPYNLALFKSIYKIIPTVEFRHLNIRVAYLVKRVGITTSTFRNTIFYGSPVRQTSLKVFSSFIEKRQALCKGRNECNPFTRYVVWLFSKVEKRMNFTRYERGCFTYVNRLLNNGFRMVRSPILMYHIIDYPCRRAEVS